MVKPHARSGLDYQPEVDGLRALAVVPVILFHAGFSQFSGGFVGVDVFFVISGYLITRIIVGDVEKGRFSLLHFYERRVRRIIPALMLVVIASVVAGLILFLPYQLDALGRSAINATTFTSNIWFWREAGYFSQGASLEPLLHTWSLSVEEQFYLFFPLGIWLLARLRIALLAAVLGVFLISLIGSEALVHQSQPATFYLLPTRAWELMLGAMLALMPVREAWSQRIRDVLGLIGLLLIAYPVFTYSEETVFPGLSALPPCLGTALIILAGSRGGGAVTRAIGSRPLVAVGLISYSLYLWHWPILVFTRQMVVTTQLSVPVALSCIAASGALAWLSWRFVEKPFRDRSRVSGRATFGAAAAMALITVGAGAAVLGGVRVRMEPETLGWNDAKEDVPATIASCLVRGDGRQSCAIGGQGEVSFAVWGDSHSAGIGGAIDLVGRHAGRAGLIYGLDACPPGSGLAEGLRYGLGSARCRHRNSFVLNELTTDRRITTVVLVAYWQEYEGLDRQALLAALDGGVSALGAAGKDVVILAGLPTPGFHAPWAFGTSSYLGRPLPASHARPGVDPALVDLAKRRGARLIALFPSFCPGGACQVQHGGRLLFFDSNHVSNHANRALIAPYLLRQGLLSAPAR